MRESFVHLSTGFAEPSQCERSYCTVYDCRDRLGRPVRRLGDEWAATVCTSLLIHLLLIHIIFRKLDEKYNNAIILSYHLPDEPPKQRSKFDARKLASSAVSLVSMRGLRFRL